MDPHVALCCMIAVACLISSCTAVHPGNRRALRNSERDDLLTQFTAAALSGNLELTKQIQQQILQLDEQRRKQDSKRKLLQARWFRLVVGREKLSVSL